MDDIKRAKINMFINDRQMESAIYEFILEEFLKEDSKDINVLASSMISITKLKKAWKGLETFKTKIQQDKSDNSNVGL